MSTHGTVHFKDGKKTIVSIYRQYDSYPTGLGQDIKDLVLYAATRQDWPCIPTMDSFAAWVIGKLKGDSAGNVYITQASDRQEFNYFVSRDLVGNFILKVTSEEGSTLYSGYIADFNPKSLKG